MLETIFFDVNIDTSKFNDGQSVETKMQLASDMIRKEAGELIEKLTSIGVIIRIHPATCQISLTADETTLKSIGVMDSDILTRVPPGFETYPEPVE